MREENVVDPSRLETRKFQHKDEQYPDCSLFLIVFYAVSNGGRQIFFSEMIVLLGHRNWVYL